MISELDTQMPPRIKRIDIFLLAVGGVMLAFLATAHIIVVPELLDSWKEFGLTVPPVTRFALSTEGLLLAEVPGLALFFAAAVSLWRGQKRRGGVLSALCILVAFIGGVLFVTSTSLPEMPLSRAPKPSDFQQEQ